MIKRIVSVGLIALIACIGIVAPVMAANATLYEHFNTGVNSVANAYGTKELALQFTAQTESHTTVYFKLSLYRVGNPGSVVIDFRNADPVTNSPVDPILATTTINGNLLSTGPLPIQFAFVTPSIIGGQKYTIVISAPQGDVSNNVNWEGSNAGGLAGAQGFQSTDGGLSWVSLSPTIFNFEIWGNPSMSISSALVTQNFIENGDMLFTLEYINIYPPYYQSTDSKQYFSIFLYDTDGTTPIASTPMLNWGDYPGSIYLNPTMAAHLTAGSGYYLALVGNFGANPAVSYQLQSTDWSGNIDGWVMATAHNMELYYSTSTSAVSLTTADLQNGGKILNNEGGAIFSPTIPGLMQVHPELFNVVVINPTVPVQPIPAAPYGSGGNWVTAVGPNISGFMNDLAGIFGTTGKQIGTMMVLGLYLALVLVLVSKGAHVLGGLAVGTPMLFVGTSTFLFDLQPILGVGMILGFIVLIGYFVTRT